MVVSSARAAWFSPNALLITSSGRFRYGHAYTRYTAACIASEPPMSRKMAATASAWASVFSPVSSDSQASRGSANARARGKACAWCGRLSAVADTMAAGAAWVG